MELEFPITIYWDIPDDAEQSRLLGIAAEIIDCRPLMVQVTSTAPALPDGFEVLLERFRGAMISATLTIPPSAHGENVRAFTEQGLVRELLIAVDKVDLLDDAEWTKHPSVGISFALTSASLRRLPDMVHHCPGYGITRLVFPMQRLYGGEPPFFLSLRDQRELAEILDSAGGASMLSLTIHDPFLWRALNPDMPFPQGGCQAANTMIAIAPDGGVYPCPTLPVRLGTIGETPLKEIIASSTKKELRRKLLGHPGACMECTEVPECRGGCRGRAYVVHQSLEGEDPACW